MVKKKMEWMRREESLVQSTKEDLEEQLERQNVAHLKLLGEVEREKEKLDEYRELLNQLQRKDRFFQPAKERRRSSQLFEEDDDGARQRLLLELENRYLKLEIEALESQIAQVDEDREHLKVKQNSISQQAEEDTREAIKDSFEETILASIKKAEKEIEGLERDVKEEKLNRSLMQQSVDIEKGVAKEMNRSVMEILEPELSAAKKQVDVDQLLVESCELRKKYKKQQEDAALFRSEIQTAKEAVRARRTKSLSYGASKKKVPTKIYCYSDASRALSQVRLRTEAGDDCSNYLQKMVLGLLESLDVKDQLIQNQSKGNRTLGIYLTKLCEKSPPLTQEEEQRLSKKIEVSKAEDGGLQVSIEFEQPKVEAVETRRNSVEKQRRSSNII